jgi:charged multivesicular body protein 2A
MGGHVFAEILRENQRALRRAMRELERERTNLQRQEKNLTIEIKQMAKKGQMVRCLTSTPPRVDSFSSP